MKIFVIIDRGFTTETRAVEGTREECRDQLEYWSRTQEVIRVLNAAGQEVPREDV